MNKILVISRDGVVASVLTEPEAEVFLLDWTEIANDNRNYVVKLFEQAQDWCPEWRQEIIFSELIESAERLGVPLPAWVKQERNRDLLQTLRNLQ